MSNNLNLDQVSPTQTGKEVTINTALGEIDAALTGVLSVSVASANATVTTLQMQRNQKLFITGATIAGRTVTLPAVARLLAVQADSTNTQSISLVVGSTTQTLAPGVRAMVMTDGTTNGMMVLIGASASTELSDMPAARTAYKGLHVKSDGSVYELIDLPYDISVFVEAVMTNGETLFSLVATRAFRIPSGAAGSAGKAGVAATASTTVTLTKNGSSFGTLVWAIAGTAATVTVSADTDFAVGDVLAILGPATADATLSAVAISLAGNRR